MSSQAYNQTVEAEFDKHMTRTKNRPIASGRVSKRDGALISAGLAAGSVGMYSMGAHPMSAVVAGGVWVGYSLIYTPLKRTTEWNTFIGAIVGSMPPFIGCFAALGSLFSVETLLLTTYIFSW